MWVEEGFFLSGKNKSSFYAESTDPIGQIDVG